MRNTLAEFCWRKGSADGVENDEKLLKMKVMFVWWQSKPKTGGSEELVWNIFLEHWIWNKNFFQDSTNLENSVHVMGASKLYLW